MRHSTQKRSATPSQAPYRIALCITELDVGGAERQFVRLALGLDRSLFEPRVYCLGGEGALARPLKEAGIGVTCLHTRGRWDVSVVGRLAVALREFRPDLLQTFLFHANIAGRLAARRAGVRSVFSGVRVTEPRRWHLWLDRWTERLVDRHVCVSEAVARHCRDVAGLSAGKIVVIPNGIDTVRLAAARPAVLPIETVDGEKPQVILFVGRLERQKDPQLLIEAFRRLASGDRRLYLAMVGSGSLEAELRRGARDLDDRVLWLGPRNDIPELMKAATCLALPSRWEGMPNVLLEAMAAGLPVVARDVAGVPELLGEGKYGEMVEGSTPEALAAGLDRVLENPSGSRKRAELAQLHVSKEFTVQTSVLGYQNLFLEFMKYQGGGSSGPLASAPRDPGEKNWENLQSQPG